MKKIQLSKGQMRAEFQPQWGGLLSSLMFNHPANGWVDALVREEQAPASRDGIPFFGCFLMVPFANRLLDGVMQADGSRWDFPVKLAPDNLAIHGTGWDQPWTVDACSDAALVMSHAWVNASGSYRFSAELSARLEDSAINLDLRLTNRSDGPRPMGFGFHPWFSGIHQSQVRFGQALPVNSESPWRIYPTDSFAGFPATFRPADFDGVDACFDDWDQKAQIELAACGLQIEMVATGAVNRLHGFVFGEKDRFCLEPVSHKPGDLSDPAFLVAPGKSVSGGMTLGCRAV